MVAALKLGAALAAGIDHPAYLHTVAQVPVTLRELLLADLN